MMSLASLAPKSKTRSSLGPLPKSLLQLIIQRAAETSREKPDTIPTPVLPS